MQFIQEQGWYKAIRITGPSHNMLAIRFTLDEAMPIIGVEPIRRLQDKIPDQLPDEDVRRQVVEGLAEANIFWEPTIESVIFDTFQRIHHQMAFTKC